MLTEIQKTNIAELVRKIMAVDLPPEVREEMLGSFHIWPGDDCDDVVDIVVSVEYEVPPWLK